ncbi:unnamed protein product [Symbiodinium sp. CCMP2456]|nr:unnamed protein product [Symbiodinium sp. CCMP2456]
MRPKSPEGTMKQILSAQRPAEARPDRAKRTVSVHCPASPSLELDVSFAEVGREVAERITARVLHQVQHDEIWYVVRKLGAGCVAMCWPLPDVVALTETLSLTWYSSQQLNQGIQLLNSLRSLTFGQEFNRNSEGINYPAACRV